MNPSTLSTTRRPRRRVVAVGVVAAALTVVGGAGAAMAAAPTSPVAEAVAGVLAEVGIDWSAMPEGYTRAQYEAFWGAGYTPEDVAALGALWSTDDTQTKARAGQALLDGETLPVAPGSTAPEAGPTDVEVSGELPEGYTPAQYAAFWDAGYTADDLEALSTLWSTDATETKARAGQMLLDGQTPPVAPGSTPASGS
ncbi:hypothetical protein [Cellulomonas biazotea]|uniref:Secreted protein n=1 Tax=Cellulomonas biazotea TaxID=1709 RepID=A0A402DTR1_9CELL|nr:hypothetical protein [Cellulomonas biazotea]GCE77504.1 hypothetical protein CBZ_25600 [Cellulomonas biazotea]